MSAKKYIAALALLFALLLIAVSVSLCIGDVSMPWNTFFSGFDHLKLGISEETAASFKTIVMEIRLPRILAVLICSIALSVSGAAYQSMFMNPLVSPDLLGVLAGAAFGASIGLLCGSTEYFTPQILAFIFGILSVGLSVTLSKCFAGNQLTMLIMGGVISASLFTSLVSVTKYAADIHSQLPAIEFWLMGSFSSISSKEVCFILPAMLVGALALIALSGYLNVLSMGDEEAAALGVNVSRIRNILIGLTTLVCSLSVAIAGMIGWIGLMIPHIARMICGQDNRQLLPVSALLGGIYLLIADLICRTAFPSEMPIGILTSLMGVPFFIFVLYKTKNRWN